MGGRQNSQKYYSLTVGTGTSFYWGDLCETGNGILNPHPQLNFSLRARLNERISMRLEGQYYQIGASDAKFGDASRQKRNLSFRSDNFEVDACAQFDLVPPSRYQDRYSRRSPFNIYVFGGIGLTTNTPKALYKGEYVDLRSLQTEGVAYSALQPVVPLGVGVRMTISPTSDILFEYGYRLCFTDYLDDVSGKYLPRDGYTSPTAYALGDRRGELNPAYYNNAFADKQYNYRGNPSRNDAYAILSVKYMHTFTAQGFQRWKRGLTDRRFRGRRTNRYK